MTIIYTKVGWLVGFYGISTIAVFFAKVILSIMVSNYMLYKNTSSQSFQINK